MKRRSFLAGSLLCPPPVSLRAQEPPRPIAEPHFPNRLYQFVWRNWELANLDRLARVVQATPAAIEDLGRSMGLPPKPLLSPDQLRRVYVTVIRQNWHLLPLGQLMDLLAWSREKLAFTLKEDDFLDIKLGPKPPCQPVRFSAPGPAEKRRAAQIRSLVESRFGRDLAMGGEPACHFVSRLSRRSFELLRDPAARPAPGQVDISGWAVRGEPPVDSRLVERLEEYLREAMSAGPGSQRGHVITLRIEPPASRAEGSFSVQVEESRVSVSGTGLGGLLQAICWLQDEMESNGGPFLPRGLTERVTALDPRYLYSYFALYGDPLLEPEIDPFPDGYLEKLGKAGINGVWMQCVLSTMAPSKAFPEFGRRSAERLARLKQLAARAKSTGLKIYLYLNEPRAMPAAFFRSRPEIQGAESRGLFAMCTTPPIVREWISDSLAHIFREVPELGGVFCITMSENFTNCFSRLHPETCPRCSKRTSWDTVGEVLEAIRMGVRRASRGAEVIVWDWAWPEAMCRNLIPKLPRDVRFLSVSEWSIPLDRGGVRTRVGEYSISVVGPGPRATANWTLAGQAGVRTMAKTQFNNTWEISAVPYIPVCNLIARHCENLLRCGISGVMASWTLGGYPSPNLEIAREFYFSPAGSAHQILERVSVRRYGKAAAPLVLQAWSGFSEAFQLYPYSVAIYTIPTQHGPANLLRATPTTVKSSMILFPQDDYRNWSGEYPPEVAQREFARMAERWGRALPVLQKAVALVPASRRERALEDLAIAETCYLHFRSTANQLEFYILRDRERTAANRARMRDLAQEEAELARRLYPLARRHAVIGYEASNHYYYRPTDLIEKVLNCQYLLDNELVAQVPDRRGRPLI